MLEDNADPRQADREGEVPRPFQVQTYAHLLSFPGVPAGTKETPRPDRNAETAPAIDAIIVPTVRAAEQLRSAVDLATHARCQLVVLYTDGFPDGLSSVLAKLQPGMATELIMSSDAKHHRLDLGPAIRQTRVSACAVDISRKRNLGLLIGRACGWRRMLFLDDDIRKLNVGKLKSAAMLLDKYPVVGLQVNKYPDASVVGHARRLTGRRQEPFISGGSLLVDPRRMQGFFPAVYHEDWLCLIEHLRYGEVAIGGQVGQLAYRPFTTPERAELEEFGDILASGLLWLVHARKSKEPESSATGNDYSAKARRDYWLAATESRFWGQVLSERAALLDDIAKNLPAKHHHLGVRPLESVVAAQKRCAELSPSEFVLFMDEWLNSLDTWQTRLSEVPQAESVADALTHLGLSHVTDLNEPGRWRERAASARRWLAKVPHRRPALVRDGLEGQHRTP